MSSGNFSKLPVGLLVLGHPGHSSTSNDTQPALNMNAIQKPLSGLRIFSKSHTKHLKVFFFFNFNSGGGNPKWVHSARRPLTGLLYLPRMIVRMENLVE
jgi:hypothetical protein